MQESSSPLHAIIVMGVSGSGKSSLAAAIAERIKWRFFEGDHFHPSENVDKMSRGVPLTDDDRWGWLKAIRDCIKENGRVIFLISLLQAQWFLRRVYRDVLRDIEGRCLFLLINVERSELEHRLSSRVSHYMPPSLLSSQLALLEVPDPSAESDSVVLDGRQSVEELLEQTLSILQEQGVIW